MPLTLLTSNNGNRDEHLFLRHHFAPRYIPAAGEDLFTQDSYIEEIVLTNVTAGAVTVTVADKQGSPLSVLQAVSIAANTTYEIGFKGRYCPGGVHWSCSVDNSVVGYMRVRY